ncbi:hypothetical protein PG994_002262 [Apiospora phragmitis]|uniref:Uncharacterized protein n=1 Tax=Apiospora phragmitis TaxID=2905665 RepID=A0ABR1WVV4_9PEZI
MSEAKLHRTLERLHPAVARRRLEELEMSTEFFHDMPLDCKHVEALRGVLRSIAMNEVPIDPKAMARLEKFWYRYPDSLMTMTDFLQAAIPISDDELRLAVYRLLNKDNMEILGHEALWRSGGPTTLSHELKKLYQKQDGQSKEVRGLLDRMIKKMRASEKEALYLHLTEGTDAPPLHSELTRLAFSCNVNIAKQVVPELDGDHDVLSPMWKLLACLRCSPEHETEGGMSAEYTSRLYQLIRLLRRRELKALFTAVHGARARLCSMPRQAARNYLMARRQGASDGNLQSAIYKKCTNGRQPGVESIVEDLAWACADNRVLADQRKVTRKTLDAPVDDLIEVHNSLINYLAYKG